MTEKKLSFSIDENLAIKLKQKALDERTTQKALLTKWIKEKLENTN
mgnify:CR=1 FL=1